MFPVFLSVGNFAVTSFGLFFALSFILGIFLVWRLARAWDLDEEKLLDMVLLTIIGGLIGARGYFVLENFSSFGFDPLKWIHIYRYQGFSFWGGFLGGWLSLALFSRKLKADFYLLADMAAVGFLGGLALANMGCFLGGCNLGVVNQSFGVEMVGFLGKRFPVQIVEAFLLCILVLNLWGRATHFHKKGIIIALSLIFLGLIELILIPLKPQSLEWVFSLAIFILGLVMFYRVSGRNILGDIKGFGVSIKLFLLSNEFRQKQLISLQKEWYNQKVTFQWRFKNFTKLLRRFNVKLSHKNSKFD